MTNPAEPPARLQQAEAWVFDLDNTLYPAACDLFAQVDQRIRDYIATFLGLPPDDAYRIQKQYFREHGTTMRGMMQHHGMDPGPFLEYVHDIDLTPIPPSPRLASALARLPGRKFVFTNGSANHANRVMDRLGVRHYFDAVFDIIDAGYLPKPEPAVYTTLVERHGLRPNKTVMVEDIVRNLIPAAALGMTTVWVRNDSRWGLEGGDETCVHYVVDDLVEWLNALTAPKT
jgi:putative hydrolase of the HAD superfamily